MENLLPVILPYVWLVAVFLVGATVGSFINVCIHRLPYEKSVLWPLGSRCGNCYQPIRLVDNIPLVSYWMLRGRCRTCGARFSMRYFWVELLTGLGFVGLFYLEVLRNIHGLEALERERYALEVGVIPLVGWVVFAFHALLLALLIAVSVCDLEHMEIPLSLTIPGTLIGLVGAVLFPWPWPDSPPAVVLAGANLKIPSGLYPWPVWLPLPEGLAPGGNWQTGLATGLAGMLAGTLLLRAVRFVFGLGRGMEGLGVGDADLMMMAGAFLGWQPVVVSFFVAVFPALVFGLIQLALRGDQALPFGPSLAAGVVITWLCWSWIGPHFQAFFFDGTLMLLVAVFGGFILFVAALLLRMIRR